MINANGFTQNLEYAILDQGDNNFKIVEKTSTCKGPKIADLWSDDTVAAIVKEYGGPSYFVHVQNGKIEFARDDWDKCLDLRFVSRHEKGTPVEGVIRYKERIVQKPEDRFVEKKRKLFPGRGY